tara:strand:+ start:6967 stop:8028 length:1062 start_codon:yes stop_codon:yes gene_type:complete
MTLEFPASTYPESIFKQTTPDETQSLADGPRYTELLKGWRTRSIIYERQLPDGTSNALRIQGPSGGNAAIILNDKGSVKIKCGPYNTNVAGSGLFGIQSQGQQQQHLGRSNLQYNVGGTEDEGQALNVLAYGDVVEQCIGGTRYIKATKILLSATDDLVIKANNISLRAQGEIQLGASQITRGAINDKEIVVGQKMTFGPGEETTMQFDPRAQVNIISPGNLNHKVLGDYKLKALGCVSLFALGGAGTLVKNRSVGMSLSTRTKFAAGGTAESRLVSSGKVIVDSVVKTEIGSNASVDVIGEAQTFIGSSGQVEIDATKVDISSETKTTMKGATVDIDGTAAVTITGAFIYLN